MVSRTTMNIGIRILLFCLGVFFTIGIAVSVSNVPATGANPAYTGVFQYCNETIQVSPSQNYSNVIVLLSIKNTGDKTYSMDPQNWIVGIKGKPYHSSIDSEIYFSDVNNGWDITPGNEGSMSLTYVVDGFVDVGSPVDLTYIGKNCTPPKTLPCTIQSLADNSLTTTTKEEESDTNVNNSQNTITSTNDYNSALVKNYDVIQENDISMKALTKSVSAYTTEELNSLPINTRKEYRVVISPDISKEELKSTLIQVVMDKTSANSDIDEVVVFAYDRKEDINDAFTLGKVEWCPNGDWGSMTPEIASSNDRSSYQYVFDIKDKVNYNSNAITNIPSKTNAGSESIIANSNTHVYHNAGCRYVPEIHSEHLTYLNSRKEAEAAGYRACKVCGG